MKENARKPNSFGNENVNQPFDRFNHDYAAQEYVNKQNYTRSEMRKRQNKKRKLKNGVRNTLITLGIIIVFAVIGIALSLTVFFNISSISATGSGIYSEDEIIRMCGIETGENLFLIDIEGSAEKLKESLPYIYNVNIKRKLPVTLSIEVTDAVPKFSIKQDDGSYILLDDMLKVLETSADSPQSTVLITDTTVISSNAGLKIQFENEDTADCIEALSEAINAVGMEEATSLSSVDKNNNYIIYDERITFELGDCGNLENKLYRGLAACEKLDESNTNLKGKLDLSYGKESYFTPK